MKTKRLACRTDHPFATSLAPTDMGAEAFTYPVAHTAARPRTHALVIACMFAAIAFACSLGFARPAMAAEYKDLSGNGYISYEDARASCDIRPEHFEQLGLDISTEVPADTPAPFPEGKATDVISAREVYVEANGANANRYTVRGNLNVLGPKNGATTKAHDSHGDLKGAYGWWNLSKKYPDSDHGGSRASHLSSNTTEVLASEGAGYYGKYATSVPYSAKAGSSARKDHVAELRAEGTRMGTLVGNDWYTGGIYIALFAFDEKGKRTEVGKLSPTVNESQVVTYDGHREFKHLDAGYLQEYDAYFEVEAGDVDGDGIDEIFAYAGAYEDENGRRLAIVDFFKSSNGTSYTHEVLRIDAGSAASYITPDSLAQHSSTTWRWQMLKTAPVVTLATGDLDRNGTDELAVTVSAPNWNTAVGATSACHVLSWNAASRKLSSAKGLERIELGVSGDAAKKAGLADGSGMTSANCAFGTFPLENTPYKVTALVIGGYQTQGAQAGDQNGITVNRVAYRYVYYDPAVNDYVVSDYRTMALGTDASYIVGSATRRAAESRRYLPTLAPLAMGCAQLERIDSATAKGENVMFGGDVYSFDLVSGAGAVPVGHLSLYSSHYNNSHSWSKDKDQVWIGDVVSGIVSDDGIAHESFLAVVGLHRDDKLRDDDDYYWMDLAHFTYDKGVAGAAHVCTGQEGVISESNRVNKQYGTYISLCLPDIDDDSVRIRYKAKTVIPTSPQLLAILQDSPTFSDLDGALHYVSSGATCFGKGRAHGAGNGLALSLAVGGHLEAEWNIGIVAGFDASLQGAGSYAWQMRNTVAYDVSYEAAAGGGDKAVVYTIPLVYYLYEAYNPDTKKWVDYYCPVSCPPVTSVVSVDEWNTIADEAPSLLKIDEKVLASTSGDPDTYAASSLGGTRVYTSTTTNATTTRTKSPNAATTQTITYTNEDEHDIQAGLSVAVTGRFGIGFSSKGDAGPVINFDAGYTHAEINTREATFSGTVDNMPELDELANSAGAYGFTWKLAVNRIGKKNVTHAEDNLWLVGYELTNIERPDLGIPPDFKVDEVGSDYVKLSWGAANFGPGAKTDECAYGVGLLDANDTGRVAQWRKVDARQTSFTWEGLAASSSYRFVVRAARGSFGGTSFAPDASSAPSVVASAHTLAAGETCSLSDLEVLSPERGTVLKAGEAAKLSIAGAWHRMDEGELVDASDEVQYTWQVKAPGKAWKPILMCVGPGDVSYDAGKLLKAQARLSLAAAGSAGGLVTSSGDEGESSGEAAVLTLTGMQPELDGTLVRCQAGIGTHVLESNTVVLHVSNENSPVVSAHEEARTLSPSDAAGALVSVAAGKACELVDYTLKKEQQTTPSNKSTGGTVGKTYKVSGYTYKVTSNSPAKATLVKAKNVKKASVPASVKINGKTYKVCAIGSKAFSKAKKATALTVGKNVSKISAKAFAGTKKLKSITLKTTRLAKKSVKGSLRGSRVGTVKVKLGSKAANRKYQKKYAKIFTKKNAGRAVKVK